MKRPWTYPASLAILSFSSLHAANASPMKPVKDQWPVGKTVWQVGSRLHGWLVRAEDNMPLVGVKVVAIGSGYGSPSIYFGTTDSNGEYRFVDMTPSEYGVSLADRRYDAGTLTIGGAGVKAGEDVRIPDFRVSQPGEVRCTVRDARTNAPVEGESVYVEQGASFEFVGSTPKSGTLQVVLQPGEYVIRIHGMRRPCRVERGTSQALDFKVS